MPTYGYRCSNCGHEFEIHQRMSDEPLTTCPKCQGKLAKILYPVGISFKGSGFYTTDYKDAGKSSTYASSDGGSKGADGAAANGSSESKSDSKSESKFESKSQAKSESKSDTKPASKSESKTEKKAS
ncbi:MAG TPA: FmdB family zinc ribbon protein [Candidatus Dormibacteraeota bacterium]